MKSTESLEESIIVIVDKILYNSETLINCSSNVGYPGELYHNSILPV